MLEFVLLHLDSNYCKSLVKAILYIIEKDTHIKDSDQFYISPEGSPKTKADINHMDQVCLPTLLVGVMHYILLYRGKNNTDGSETLNEWSTQQPSRKGIYNRDAIRCIDREIEVLFDCPQFDTDVSIQKSEMIEEEPVKEVQILRELSSSEIYAKIFSLERKIMEHHQPTSTRGIIRLTKPNESDTITNPISTTSKPDQE